MKKQTTIKLFEWHYVYRGTNKTRKEIYHGISKSVEHRIDGSHCTGGTKALSNWTCQIDQIDWEVVSKHKTQHKASEISHKLEKKFKKRGYTNFITKGK